jgi:dCTP deaminase
MGVLSDRQIKERSIMPIGVVMNGDSREWSVVIPDVTHPQELVKNWDDRSFPRFHRLRGKNDEERLTDLRRFMDWKPLITPFVPEPTRFIDKTSKKHALATDGEGHPFVHTGELIEQQKIISYGLSSYGYDVRIKADGVKLFTNLSGEAIDPMRPYGKQLADPIIHFDEEFGLHYFLLPPNSVALAHTVEWFNISRDLLVICLGKSTYARVGLTQLMTPLEPEWEGELVLEIASMTNLPTRVYLECGIAQLVFLLGDEECEVSYKDKGGKYQGQTGTTLART